MDINFKNYCTVTVQMKDYLQESIDESGLSITREVTTPARKNLFYEWQIPTTRRRGNLNDSKVL